MALEGGRQHTKKTIRGKQAQQCHRLHILVTIHQQLDEQNLPFVRNAEWPIRNATKTQSSQLKNIETLETKICSVIVDFGAASYYV